MKLYEMTDEQLIAHCESSVIVGVSDHLAAFREVLKRFKASVDNKAGEPQ